MKFKKIILTITLLALFSGITVNAQNLFSLKLPEEFYSINESAKTVAEIFNISVKELNNYCKENNVEYLAVNKNNTKQIKITVNENEFSNEIINLSNFEDEEILNLSKEIVGIENFNGDITKLDGQKFLKVEFSSSDSGGEYILTQYITTCQKKNVIISFYTDSSLDTEFTHEIFNSITSPMFIRNDTATLKAFSAAVPFITIAFVLICIALSGSIIIDIKEQKNRSEEDEDFNETQKEDNV